MVPMIAREPAHAANVAAETAAHIKPLPQAVAELEARVILEALAATGGNKLAASKLLGISRATLYEKLPMVERARAEAAAGAAR